MESAEASSTSSYDGVYYNDSKFRGFAPLHCLREHAVKFLGLSTLTTVGGTWEIAQAQHHVYH